jgi:predicted amidohydrolase YtcJ
MTNSGKAEILLKSNCIYTAVSPEPLAGFVAVADGKILAVGSDGEKEYIGRNTAVYELGDKLVCPGFADVHCFFTGYVLRFVGADLSCAGTAEEIIEIMKRYACEQPSGKALLGHGWDSEKIKNPDPALLDKAFAGRPVILFEKGQETCWMNEAAEKTYQFTPETCYPEAYWKLLGEVLGDRAFIVPEFKKYMAMLNSRGVTSVKEMGFDDFYGFTDVLEGLEKKNELTLRVNFMSQPVGAGMNLAYGREMRNRFQGDFIRFSGYNRMTDGSISQLCGDLKEPYCCAPNIYCAQEIDYDLIEKETLAADAENFRFSLHAQGDAAICKVLDIYEKCKRENGRLVNRHSITDLEFSDPSDLERMGKLGVIAEIYPQIMAIADRKSKLEMIEEKIGMERGRYYWNRRKMADSGVLISCGTDLPLLIDDIPESIYHACGGQFPEGGEPFNKENTLTVSEVMRAWTYGGQYNLYREKELGTLEPGKKADIAVLDGNVFTESMQNMRAIKACLTLVEGKVVYTSL